jgi:exo-beta-1,3-glucanase (GH17 family)/cellulose synthase/poly-beta-1,6-N-acetylglucosamine synthase-like glycosyltransferase
MTRIIFTGLLIAATFGMWEVSNRPVDEPLWSGKMSGFAYSPIRPGQAPGLDAFPTEAEIEADIAIIARHGQALRTYSIDGTLARIPAIAGSYELDVIVGVWLDGDLAGNRDRLDRLQALVPDNPNVAGVIVGNETLLSGALAPEALIAYLDEMRERLEVPVSTAEPWHIWRSHPELAASVDFLTVHQLPYWEGIPAEQAVGLVISRTEELARMFADKPVVIGEVGWPSNGRSLGRAAASRQDAETFLRQFLTQADALGLEYFLMEAFDQPWKRAEEGEVGAYWGLFDGARGAKYALDQSLVPVPERRTLATFAASLAVVSFLLLTTDSRRLRLPGFGLLASAAFVAANAMVFCLHDYLQQYWTFGRAMGAAVIVVGLIGIVLLVFVEVHEWAEANCKQHSRANPVPPPSERCPKVSIHVPTYEEPPAMLIETLNSLAALDYSNYEVLVIDNNTRSEALWRPVEAHCARLGARFRFYHVAPLAGYKAGALNFALQKMAPDAEIVAIIDSDYRVEPGWLTRLVPHFANANTALVQAPQDYRDQHARAFKTLCEAEYRGFFHIGMVTRNERNAIIQHGTMTMIRAAVLREVGGWAEWTVTEDAELGLRILEHGYDSVYATDSLGHGLTPDRFRDYRSQRFRWAIGATQILRMHGRKLLGLEPSKLTPGQRFHFLTGWAAWLGDGLNLAFNLLAIAWSTLMILSPSEFLAPIARFSAFVIAFFAFKLVKMAWLYRRRVRASVGETLAAIVAGLSLVYITGRAVLAGAAGTETRFVRTPKFADKDGVLGALEAVAGESLLAVALIVAAYGVTVSAPFASLDRQLWTILLIVFAVPHMAAVTMSLLGTLPGMKGRRPAVSSGDAVTDVPKG